MGAAVRELRLSVRLLHPFRAVLEEEGIALAPLLESAELSPDVFSDLDALVDRKAMARFLAAAQAATRLPALGLRAARYYDKAQYHMLEYFAASSADGEAALEGLVRHQRLFADASGLSLEPRPEGTLLRFRPHATTSRAFQEYVIGGLALAIVRAAGIAPRPVDQRDRRGQVWFAYPEPPDSDAYNAFFGRRPVFEAPVTGILLVSDRLKEPLRRANTRVRAVLERQLEQMSEVTSTGTLTGRVRKLLASELAGTPMGLSEVARRLYMSPSTLKRRLMEEGTTFNDVLDDLRYHTARQHLTESEASIGEIACLVGYRDVTAFSRAFRRWSGEAPSNFRRKSK